MANKIVWDYELIERVGEGGFGLTFRSEHVHLRERMSAVKLVQPPFVGAFKASGETLAHFAKTVDGALGGGDTTGAGCFPRIETLRYDVDEPYVVTEWVQGGSVDGRTRSGELLQMDEIIKVLADTFDALEFLHARGLVHGNLKPSNILLDRDGSARLSDFGGFLTGEGITPSVQSWAYLSPEQLDPSLLGEQTLDGRADLFALTAVLYEMLTGLRLPRVMTLSQMPSEVNRRVPSGFDDIIAQGLEPNRDGRFANAGAMRGAVLAAAGMAERLPTDTAAAGEEEADAAVDVGPAPPRPAGETRVNPKDGAELVWVPPGTLHMGSDEHEGEGPAHGVEVEGFWIYKQPVTQSQYLEFLRATADPNSPTPPPRPTVWLRGDEHLGKPVAGIDWNRARGYCEWAGVRLPAEAEWEWAARGPEGHVYPWGDTFDASRANTRESGQGGQIEAGSFGTSWCKADDMSGNVFEWCSSLLVDYPYDPEDGREDPGAPGPRVLRGGSAKTDASSARASYRARPNPPGGLTGLRPALTDEATVAREADAT